MLSFVFFLFRSFRLAYVCVHYIGVLFAVSILTRNRSRRIFLPDYTVKRLNVHSQSGLSVVIARFDDKFPARRGIAYGNYGSYYPAYGFDYITGYK